MRSIFGVWVLVFFALSCHQKRDAASIPKQTDSLANRALWLDSALSADSANIPFWVERAQTAEALHDTAGAIGFYLEANRLYPTPEAMLSLANLLAETKDSRTLNVTANAKKLYPYKSIEPDIHFINGVYWSRVGAFKKALSAFDSCIRGNYRYYEAYMEKGFILYESKKYPEAKTIFATIIPLNPSYADAYYWLAKMEEMEGNKAEAINRYEQALQLDSSITEATIALKRLTNN